MLLGATCARLPAYAALGLRSMQVGLEAVVDPRTFTLEGGAARTVRKAVNRVHRRGWTIEVIGGGELDRSLAAELALVEAAWRRGRGRRCGFAMASDRLWGAPEDAADVYAIARNPDGEARAFQRYVRYRRGLSLDAMCRLDDDPNGIADSLVAAVLERAREQGFSEVSLNFSGFGHLMAADTLERRAPPARAPRAAAAAPALPARAPRALRREVRPRVAPAPPGLHGADAAPAGRRPGAPGGGLHQAAAAGPRRRRVAALAAPDRDRPPRGPGR